MKKEERTPINKILVVSHSNFSKGLLEATEMIIGKTNHIDHLGLRNNGGVNLFKEEVRKYLDTINEEDHLIVLADLLGGSPYTSVLEILSKKSMLDNVFVIGGANLGLLLELNFMEDFKNEEEIKKLINEARSGISMFTLNTENIEEDDL